MRAPNCATGPLLGDHLILAQRRGPGNQFVARRIGRRPAGRRLAGMREDEPPGQQIRCLPRRRAVKRHQRCRHPRQAPELRAPLIANRRDLNLIQAAADVVFEAVHGHRRSMAREEGSRDLTRTLPGIKRSAARRRRPHRRLMESSGDSDEENSVLSASAQLLHDSCTVFPQTFATAGFGAIRRRSR